MTSEINLPPLPPGYMSSVGTDVYEAQHMQSYASAAVLANRQARTCKWTNDDDEYRNWETSCGHIFCFIEGEPEENGTMYCQYCGGKTVFVRPYSIDASQAGAYDHLADAGKATRELS